MNLATAAFYRKEPGQKNPAAGLSPKRTAHTQMPIASTQFSSCQVHKVKHNQKNISQDISNCADISWERGDLSNRAKLFRALVLNPRSTGQIHSVYGDLHESVGSPICHGANQVSGTALELDPSWMRAEQSPIPILFN